MTTEAIARQIADAAGSATPLRLAGAGTWLRAGYPVTATTTLSVRHDAGIVEYVPGDLTLTARAGTSLADLVAAVKANDQWLPLDPWGGDAGTLGATISTATAGPHSAAMGIPRDVALGLEFVSGSGDTIRAGGRVVKNVAGFDLTRLLTGSWGTLGVITEVTLRLRARPAVLHSFAVPVPGGLPSLRQLAAELRALPFVPMAAELVNAALAGRLGIGDQAMLLVRLGGNTNSVSAQIAAMRALGRLADAPPGLWRALREADRDARVSWRRSQLPSAFAETWTGMERESRQLASALMHGSPIRGVVRVMATGDDAALDRAMRRGPGTLATEVMPGAIGSELPSQRRGVARLEDRIRSAFDPRGILNPGILGGAP